MADLGLSSVVAWHNQRTRHKISDRETCKALPEIGRMVGKHERQGCHPISRFAAPHGQVLFVISYNLLKNKSVSLKSENTQTAPSAVKRAASPPLATPMKGMPTLRQARASQTPSPT